VRSYFEGPIDMIAIFESIFNGLDDFSKLANFQLDNTMPINIPQNFAKFEWKIGNQFLETDDLEKCRKFDHFSQTSV
jgi:hypothetical protein